jgi:hypothetical protein
LLILPPSFSALSAAFSADDSSFVNLFITHSFVWQFLCFAAFDRGIHTKMLFFFVSSGDTWVGSSFLFFSFLFFFGIYLFYFKVKRYSHKLFILELQNSLFSRKFVIIIMLQIMRQYQFLLILIHGKNNKIICYITDNTNNHNNKYLFDRINNYFDKKK